MRKLSAFVLCVVSVSPATYAGSTCNTAPIAAADTVVVEPQSTALFAPTLNDQDIDGDPLELASVSNPVSACAGSILSLGAGLVRYTPDGSSMPGGSCSVSYSVSDGFAQSNGTVTLELTADIFSDGFETGTTGRWSSTGS